MNISKLDTWVQDSRVINLTDSDTENLTNPVKDKLDFLKA